MVVGYLAFDPSDRKRAHHPLFFLVFATVLMIMTARWKRIAEYWPPFAVMFAAFALQPWLRRRAFDPDSTVDRLLDELQPFLDRPALARLQMKSDLRALWRTIALAVVAVLPGT